MTLWTYINRSKIIVFPTFVLFILGFFSVSSSIIRMTTSSVLCSVIFFSNDEIIFRLSIGLLLVLGVIIALLLSWISSQKDFSSVRFFGCLAIAITSSLLGIWLRYEEIKSLELPADTKLRLISIDYFQWGLASMLLICMPIILVFFKKRNRTA